ncbi:MAG TPA: hypothetical protein DCW90_06690 [Lachnospiraceae bacterium]|nr:hypothetical protein [uncultured Lachnoclostridium sp.]HAU85185.1 hypothetical protein [Lachnospiraceae bacterium]
MNKKICSVIFLCLVLVSVMVESMDIKASDGGLIEISELPAIQPYTQILNNLNEELGTGFAFPTNDVITTASMNRDEVIEDILSTDIEDYEQYIRNAYMGIDSNGIKATTGTQKAYYSSSNYLSITATTYYADGASRYSSIDDYGYGHTTAPYYYPYHMSSSISGDSKTCSVVFTCYKMVNSSVSYDNWSVHSIAAAFRAGGGNITIG